MEQPPLLGTGWTELDRPLEMHTAGKFWNQTLSKVLSIFNIYYSATNRPKLLYNYRVSTFSLKQGREICRCKAASKRQGTVAERTKIKQWDVRALPLSALVWALSLATRRCLCWLQEDFKWLVYRNYFRGILYMTSSNYIKSVQLLLINLEYICVVIFRGFTEVY